MTAPTVTLAPACASRAEYVRGLLTGEHEPTYRGSTVQEAARSVIWTAPAAGHYPRPSLSDAWDLARHRPDLAPAIWHLTAGATILGPSCDCDSPGGHRDALMALARRVIEDAA